MRWMRTDTTCSRPRRRRSRIFSRLARILRVWSSTDSGSARAGFSRSTGPIPQTKPQPSTQASGFDMLEQAADALRDLLLALLGGEVVGLDVSHGRTAADVGERLRIRERAGRRDAHH